VKVAEVEPVVEAWAGPELIWMVGRRLSMVQLRWTIVPLPTSSRA
jgi:hypothetical protein